MPKKNLDQVLNQLDGQPAKRDDKPLTMRTIISEACASMIDVPDPQRKFTFGKLAYKLALSKGGEESYTPEELAAMKEAVGKNAGPLLVFQIFEFLDK